MLRNSSNQRLAADSARSLSKSTFTFRPASRITCSVAVADRPHGVVVRLARSQGRRVERLPLRGHRQALAIDEQARFGRHFDDHRRPILIGGSFLLVLLLRSLLDDHDSAVAAVTPSV